MGHEPICQGVGPVYKSSVLRVCDRTVLGVPSSLAGDLWGETCDGSVSVPPDVELDVEEEGQPARKGVRAHRVMLCQCRMLGRMFGSEYAEGTKTRIVLELPRQTQACFDAVLRFCYDRSLTWDFSDEATVDLWRLADFLDCRILIDAMRAWLESSCTARAFVIGVKRSLECGAEHIAHEYLRAALAGWDAARDMPGNLEDGAGPDLHLWGRWADDDSDSVVSALIACAALRRAPWGTDVSKVLLGLAARECGPRWLELPSILQLAPPLFAALLASIPIGSVSEVLISDLVVRWIVNCGRDFDSPTAQALLGAVDTQVPAGEYQTHPTTTMAITSYGLR